MKKNVKNKETSLKSISDIKPCDFCKVHCLTKHCHTLEGLTEEQKERFINGICKKESGADGN
jgi:hypothetical protein